MQPPRWRRPTGDPLCRWEDRCRSTRPPFAARAGEAGAKSRIERLAERLADERSRHVLLVSHCLLNQNVRYPGGAFRPGVVPEAVASFICDGDGLYQMPCPEQAAWGGVSKRWLGVRHTLDLARALPAVASQKLATIDRRTFEERVIQACATDGEGLYLRELRRALARRRLTVPFLECHPPPFADERR